jgi:hypothetical protein
MEASAIWGITQMGSNDRTPTGSANLQPWKQREPQAVISWANVPPNLIVDVITAASKVRGYVGFGSNNDSTALLLYVRCDRYNERVAIESLKEAPVAINYVIDTYLK